jgi:hypothetical protein
VEEERNDEILMTNDEISSNGLMTNNFSGFVTLSSFDIRLPRRSTAKAGASSLT